MDEQGRMRSSASERILMHSWLERHPDIILAGGGLVYRPAGQAVRRGTLLHEDRRRFAAAAMHTIITKVAGDKWPEVVETWKAAVKCDDAEYSASAKWLAQYDLTDPWIPAALCEAIVGFKTLATPIPPPDFGEPERASLMLLGGSDEIPLPRDVPKSPEPYNPLSESRKAFQARCRVYAREVEAVYRAIPGYVRRSAAAKRQGAAAELGGVHYIMAAERQILGRSWKNLAGDHLKKSRSVTKRTTAKKAVEDTAKRLGLTLRRDLD